MDKFPRYVMLDTLNPNAVNGRYGRPVALVGVYEEAGYFTAFSDEEASAIFAESVECGEVGYSDRNTERVNGVCFNTQTGKQIFEGDPTLSPFR